MLVLDNLSVKNFNQENSILDNISLTFKSNDLIAIIGKSGVGKTTLLNTICVNTNILEGCLKYKDFEFKKDLKKRLNKYRKDIGIISQSSTLINQISVYDNLKIYLSNFNNFFFRLFNLITKKQKQEIFDILNKLNVFEKVFFNPEDLSGGEIQRIEIAKVLLRKPKIILADEPTANLDINNSINVIKLLKELAINNKSIIIVNLHDTKLLNDNFNRIIGLKNKKVFFDIENKNFDQKKLKELYE